MYNEVPSFASSASQDRSIGMTAQKRILKVNLTAFASVLTSLFVQQDHK